MRQSELNVEVDGDDAPVDDVVGSKTPKNGANEPLDPDDITITKQSHIDASGVRGLSVKGVEGDIEDAVDIVDFATKLERARNYYLSSGRFEENTLSEDTFDMLWRDFTGYRDTNDYVLLRHESGVTSDRHVDTGGNEDGCYAMKLPKRGNEQYRKDKKKKIFRLLEGINEGDMQLDYTEDDGTSAVFLTLTYDTDRCSIREAWENIGDEYNVAITSLRQKYGEISAFRIFESSTKGYPHIHAVLLFHDHEFDTFQQTNGVYRIESKNEFTKFCNWHSHVDVRAVKNIGKSINYLSKYLIKDSVELADNADAVRKAKLTLALSWVFRKRSFAVSGDFRDVLFDLIHIKDNPNKIENLRSMFRWLDAVEWEFLGTYGADYLEIDRFENFVEIEPRVIDRIEQDNEIRRSRRSVSYDDQ